MPAFITVCAFHARALKSLALPEARLRANEASLGEALAAYSSERGPEAQALVQHLTTLGVTRIASARRAHPGGPRVPPASPSWPRTQLLPFARASEGARHRSHQATPGGASLGVHHAMATSARPRAAPGRGGEDEVGGGGPEEEDGDGARQEVGRRPQKNISSCNC